MTGIKIKAQVPEDATREEKRDIIAGAYQTGLTMAAGDPEIRLRMIMGEAYGRLVSLLEWVDGEIRKDNEKVPGLIEHARRAANGGYLLMGAAPNSPQAVQQRLLEEIIRRMEPTVIQAEPSDGC
jgi:hypothetical protein